MRAGVNIKIADLLPDPRNPRAIKDEARAGLQASLRAFGDVSGLTWNKRTGELVAGHQRLSALKAEADRRGVALEVVGKEGAEEVRLPAGDGMDEERFRLRVVDWSRQEQTAANIAANNPAIGGDFAAGLGDLLKEVEADFPDLFDEARFGELTALADGLSKGSGGNDNGGDGDGAEPQTDRAAELAKEWGVEQGQVWEVPSLTVPGRCHRVVCGDARDLESEPDDAWIYDPPWDADVIIRPGRPCLAFCDGQRLGDVVALLGPPAWSFVWDCGACWYTPNRPLKKHKLALFYGDISEIDPSRSLLPWGDEKPEAGWVSNKRGRHWNEPGEGKMLMDVYRSSLAGLHADVPHKHAKPPEWVRQLLGCLFSPERRVLDPFIGSGTSLIAAEQEGRILLGSDLDPGSIAVTLQRAKDSGLSPRKIS